MVYLLALLVYGVSAAVVWLAGVALYQNYCGGPPPREHPQYVLITSVTVALVTLLSAVPYPWGHLLSLAVWWLAAHNVIEQAPRAWALFLFLAALFVVSRLAVLGALAL